MIKEPVKKLKLEREKREKDPDYVSDAWKLMQVGPKLKPKKQKFHPLGI